MKFLLILLIFSYPLLADGLKDNFPDKVRQVPKAGIKLTGKQVKHFQKRNSELKLLIDQIARKKNSRLNELLPDVKIFHKAIHYALAHNEFLSKHDLKKADQILDEGIKRAKALLNNEAPWLNQTGFVVRGFISKIDNSVQPYGLTIPESYDPNGDKSYRTDIWLHGRNENVLEINFIHQRMTKKEKFTPKDTILLSPYGRYSNAFKFAGEVDVFEALAHAKKFYRIDSNRIANRGFSMGGAGCWQLAVHYSDQFFASNPGAGFSETPDFLTTFQKQTLDPKWFEKVLWRWYDCPDYSVNLKQCPTIAYSGEKDIQIQAARMMEKGFEKEGMKLLHIIGPKMGHTYDKSSAQKVDDWIAKKAKVGLIHIPKSVHFVTYTLKYNSMKWFKIDSLEKHWEKAKVDATINGNSILISTENVAAFHLDFKEGQAPFKVGVPIKIVINGYELFDKIGIRHDKSWKPYFAVASDMWRLNSSPFEFFKNTKKKDLQGPIDDAFMDSFIFVMPSGMSKNPLVQNWVDSEFNRAVKHWRQHFRGDAIIKSDKDVTPEDIANSNLILWGDSSSNSLIKKLSAKLPIKWSDKNISLKDKSFDSKDHALIMIYPNPLSPNKYIVLNSGFTYREFAYLNNARQVPMLPDWAIIDLKEKPGTVWPGKVVEANFFDESWKLK